MDLKKNGTDSYGRDDRAERLALVYREAVRGLTHQQNVVESINTRAGNLIFATAFINSLLGARALTNGLGGWDWAALALLLAIGGLVVFIIWPYHNYTFRFDPAQLLAEFCEDESQSTLDAMHHTLSSRIKNDLDDNWRIVQRLRVGLQLALVLFVLNIVAWLFAIAEL